MRTNTHVAAMATQTTRMSASSETVSSSVEFLDGTPKAKGAVLFTGPDGVGDYKVSVKDQFYVGHGAMSTEATSNATYLCRAPTDAPHPPSKSVCVGEVGWGVPDNADYTLLKTGNQIMLKEFRARTEDRHTHLYQTPYYPPPTPPQQSETHQSGSTASIAAESVDDPLKNSKGQDISS